MKKDLALETISRLTVSYKNLSLKEIFCKSHNGIELFKIYSIYADGHGFIICSSSIHLPPILGYSLESNFFPSNGEKNKEIDKLLDEIAKIALKNFSDQVTYKKEFAQLDNFQLQSIHSDEIANILPLIKTEWNQNSPFNDKVPGVTGCVPVAMGQIMKHHSWPFTSVGIIPEYKSFNTIMPAININGFSHPWDKMTNSGIGDQEGENAVADLMLHLGCAVKTQYGSSASFNTEDVAPVLKKYYCYDEDIAFGYLTPLASDTTFSSEELISIVSFNIENGKPVQLGGAGHSLICDGKDKNNFFHMNFGWGGIANGYYSLFNNPYCQTIITDIKPQQNLSIEWDTFSCSKQMILGDKFVAEIIIDSTSEESFMGDITLILADVSGVIITCLGATHTVYVSSGESVTVNFTFTVPTNLTCNSRQLGLLANNSNLMWGGKKVSGPIGCNNFVPVEIIRAKAKDNIWLRTSLEESLTFNRNHLTPVSVTLKNTGHDFYGNIALCLVDKNDNVMYEVARINGVILAGNDCVSLEFSAACPEETITGDVYTMKIFCSSDESLPVNAYPILIGGNEEIVNFSLVTIKSSVPYLDELSLPLSPNFPEHISPQTNTRINFDLYAKNGLLSQSNITLVLIDDNGVIYEIGSQKDNLGYGEGVTKHHSITPTISRSLPYGQYDIGIMVHIFVTDTYALVVSEVGVNNPVQITVDPVPQVPFVRLAESLPTSLTMVAGENFTLDSQLNLLKAEDDFPYVGTVIAYVVLPDSKKIKVGEIVEQFVTHLGPELLHMNCQLPEGLRNGVYELYLEAWDRHYPDIPSRLVGENENINDVVKIIVVDDGKYSQSVESSYSKI